RKAGRPSKALSKERLEGLLRLKIPVSRIAEDLQVSRPTVYKAIAEYNLQETRHSDIQHAVSSIKGNHPNAGEVMLQGHLRAQGINVQRSKIRKAIHDLDPSSETVLSFNEAIRRYGRPQRVRSDHGGENVLVWRDMTSAWGEDARSVIVGSSVYNQKIERHNRSVNEHELSVFKSEFYDLEREAKSFFLQTAPHILDPLNETDLFCLLYVYLPRLNKNLAEFVSAHNNHKISKEGSNTPAQIFWTNLHLTAFGEGRDPNDAWMGVNIDELASTNLPHVQVPPTSNPLHDTEYEELQRLVDLLTSTCGKELYRRTVDFVGRKLSIH
ncbi:unnamed protein product, partial [Porites lobata]